MPHEDAQTQNEGEDMNIFKEKPIIRFDWAMKYLLRDQENFDILEGFLSELLNDDIHIDTILDPESEKDEAGAKMNRVDILCRNKKHEFIIIEVQNSNEIDYLKRILFGVSKLIAQNMQKGFRYIEISKVYSVNIVFFDLGVGDDYLYYGSTNFIGANSGNELKLTQTQKHALGAECIPQIYPEFYIIKVESFNEKLKTALTTLDEWIYLFKNEEILPEFSAKGIQKAKEKLAIIKMTPKEKAAYEAYLFRLADDHSATLTPERIIWGEAERRMLENADKWKEEGEKIGRVAGKAEGELNRAKHIARSMLEHKEPLGKIAQYTGLSPQEIEQLSV